MTQTTTPLDSSRPQRIESKLRTVLQIASQDREPTMEERDQFEQLLKEIVSIKKRNLSEVISKQKRDSQNSTEDLNQLRLHKKHLTKDLVMFCNDVADLIDTKIMSNIQSAHGKVFFLKIKGDFLRYSAEYLRKEDKLYTIALQEGLKTYSTAYEIANAELPCESLVRLNLSLNFSVFYYTIVNNPSKACEIVVETLDKLDNEMESIMEEIWKYIQPTRCLLKNNLMLWSSEIEDEKYIADNHTC